MDSRKLPIQLSRMSPDTLQAVAMLEQECFSIPWSAQALADELHNPHAVFWVAHTDSRVVGYAGMHHIIDEGYITNIAVAEQARRRGVASALLGALLDHAGKYSMRMLTLEVRASNTPAQLLYTSFGFVPVGTRRGYYKKPVEDALILTLEL